MLVTAIQHLMSIREYFSFFFLWWHLVLSISLRSPKPNSMGLSHLLTQTIPSMWIFILCIFFSCIEVREDYTQIYTKTKPNITVTKTLVCVPQPVKLNVRRFDFLSLNRSPLCKKRSSSLKQGILKQRPEKPSCTFRKWFPRAGQVPV